MGRCLTIGMFNNIGHKLLGKNFFFPILIFDFRGELTSVGMREHFVLGATLRNKYITEMQFLQDTFNMSEMYIFSTDQNRTLMSAES